MVINETGGTCSRAAGIYTPNARRSRRKCSYCTGFVVETKVSLREKRHPQRLQSLTMMLLLDSVGKRSTKDQVRAALLSTRHFKRVMTQDWPDFGFSMFRLLPLHRFSNDTLYP